MLTELITSQTRIRLLIKFFLNKENTTYLRNLEREIKESSNSIRIELNNLESLNLIKSFQSGNKKFYQVNANHLFYEDIRNLLLKEFGIDKVKELLNENIKGISQILVFGDFANGIPTNILDLALVGQDLNKAEVSKNIWDLEQQLSKKIRYFLLENSELSEFTANTKFFTI